jgi:hypothetical protein
MNQEQVNKQKLEAIRIMLTVYNNRLTSISTEKLVTAERNF